MRTRGAVIRQAPGAYEVVDLVLDSPRSGELTVKMVASGLCHSDDHIARGDHGVGRYPICGGHEGAGIVVEVGPNTEGWSEGDHVVFSFLAACGRCRWCASGIQNLCDNGAAIMTGSRPGETSSYRMSLDGQPVAQTCGLSTFSEYTTVSTLSAVKVDKHLPLDALCLLGCGVGTGWGAAVNSAQVYPGQTVIVMGIGGIGINAVQGAAHAGAAHVIAVDPVAFKRESALKLGATHAVATMEEATDIARSFTNGQGADSAIVTVGVTTGEHVAQAFSSIRKAGTCVVTGLGKMTDVGIPVSLMELTLYQKRIQGSLFGASNPTADIPWMIDLYTSGKLELDGLITNRYTLDQINNGFADMHAGRNLRGIITF
ncbi:MAG: NDMA-dependent alcohol dehydrogenase [Rhodococcus sp. (in: high G+C Gram-positive bacteria)]|nr:MULTISPECIES: NDMA-dependent alcohol dehydrogenase [Rhodococcus erythropolis group]MCD2109036.1 NDMA-dependent alcohol dehydrogenase [Rhodococcus qingshengii]MCZ4527962.1 NDMA-dependent alcohol dehydrogenase [Rhodococcus erythropolis]MDZ7916834.1 NDMA-dependent alcohol dehydrogenase [Rhodococcus sp. (in: high G+C Gram-positive bacteria)]